MTSIVDPSELNLTQGIAGTLIERVVHDVNKTLTQTGATIAKIRARRHATARGHLENHNKRLTAGLIASAGQFRLASDILGYARHTKDLEEQNLRDKAFKEKEAYDILCVKVQAIRDKNLPPEQWHTNELTTMIRWYKQKTDAKIPSKKSDKLVRYFEICGRGDPPVPELPYDNRRLILLPDNNEQLPPLLEAMMPSTNVSGDPDTLDDVAEFDDDSFRDAIMEEAPVLDKNENSQTEV